MSYAPDEIRALRKRLNFSQDDLAAQLGVARSNISRWESGETRPSGPARKLLERLDASSDTAEVAA